MKSSRGVPKYMMLSASRFDIHQRNINKIEGTRVQVYIVTEPESLNGGGYPPLDKFFMSE